MCVCVCVRERERDRQTDRMRERETGERIGTAIFMYKHARSKNLIFSTHIHKIHTAQLLQHFIKEIQNSVRLIHVLWQVIWFSATKIITDCQEQQIPILLISNTVKPRSV